MTGRAMLLAYAAAAGTFLALDAVWLTLTADPLYRAALGSMMREQPDYAAAALFYVLYLFGIVVFAIRPAAASPRWQHAAGLGALFGAIAYATYDLTNQATLRGWPWHITLLDLAWGAFASACAASVGWRAARAAMRR